MRDKHNVPQPDSTPGSYNMAFSRRRFFRHSVVAAGILASAPAVTLARTRRATRRIVFVELKGGNDALNTVIPALDEAYRQARPTLAVAPHEALPLSSALALHPAMPELHRLYRRGHLAVIAGVGVPGHDRSHFGSSAAWHRGGFDPACSSGWIGRWCDRQASATDNALMAWAGPEQPAMFSATRCASVRIEPPDAPEGGEFAGAMRAIARSIAGSAPARFFHTALGGFDTHAGQASAHALLLREVSACVGRFMDSLERAGCAEDVLVLIFSEFGRRCRENGSAGTDHGAAGVVLAVGQAVNGGVYGGYPALSVAPGVDPPCTVDFRQCYAAILEGWLDTPAQAILGRSTAPVAFL